MLGFFACILHVSPDVFHHETDHHADAYTHVVCIDHQASVTVSVKDHESISETATVPSNTVPEIASPIYVGFVSYSESAENGPPNKIALYIKNNTFLI